METKSAILSVRTSPTAKAIIEQEAKASGRNISEYVLGAVLKENAANASSRAALPLPRHVEAEDAARRRWWCGDPASPTCWPARDVVLADMGPEFANIDFRASLFAETYVRQPHIAVGAFAARTLNAELADALIYSVFCDLFEQEPEAKFDAPSVTDTTKLLICDGATDYETRLAANANNRSDHLEYCLAEAERCGVAARRAHARRILRDWRERGIPWPKIEIGPHGSPYLADGTRIEMRVINNRRQPVLVTTPAPASNPEPIDPSPRPNQIGASFADLQRQAWKSRKGVDIGDL